MTTILQQISDEMASLTEGVAESVLRVDARRRIPATGIAWSENLIVTAHHVVESEADITIGTAAGERIEAELVGRDPLNDLALLRVDADLQPPSFAAADGLRVGNLALALGRPRQHIKAIMGIVSGLVSPADSRRRRRRLRATRHKRGMARRHKGRRAKWQRQTMRDIGGGDLALAGGAIQSDLTMYPGFSGGPLVGADGKVHGMTTSGFGGGFGLAIPIAAVSKSVTILLEHGEVRSGYLGIGVQPAQLPDNIAESLDQDFGLLVVSVEGESPAAAAGIMVGDILTALNDAATEDVDDLQIKLAQLAAGSVVNTSYVRGGVISEGSIVIGAR